MPWTVKDKAKIGYGSQLRDSSGTHACPVCWNINRGYEKHYRVPLNATHCPICLVELEWDFNAE